MKAIDRDPLIVEAYRRQAIIALQRDNPGDAILALSKVLSISKDDEGALVVRASLYMQVHQGRSWVGALANMITTSGSEHR